MPFLKQDKLTLSLLHPDPSTLPRGPTSCLVESKQAEEIRPHLSAKNTAQLTEHIQPLAVTLSGYSKPDDSCSFELHGCLPPDKFREVVLQPPSDGLHILVV